MRTHLNRLGWVFGGLGWVTHLDPKTAYGLKDWTQNPTRTWVRLGWVLGFAGFGAVYTRLHGPLAYRIRYALVLYKP
jgi:hypothetical protein